MHHGIINIKLLGMLLKFFERYGRGYDTTCETLEVMYLLFSSTFEIYFEIIYFKKLN